ncbi:hypothetical protein VP01_2954g4 [Puccinia sorghi]|uniref:Uncharacterized protein n=1 Tax=Puccinia sorghi TaxID=27349 RepID=A0A0L6V1Q0_9BASI|nr:hypothetical protein VP01_2954g4 [Puccinia sorghi]
MIIGRLRRFLSHDHQPAGAHENSIDFCEDVKLLRTAHHVVWNPPLVDNRDPAQDRVSAIVETPLPDGAKGPDHRVLSDLQDMRVVDEGGAGRCSGGWATGDEGPGAVTTHERRLIEAEMFRGQLTGIIAMTAVELGLVLEAAP